MKRRLNISTIQTAKVNLKRINPLLLYHTVTGVVNRNKKKITAAAL